MSEKRRCNICGKEFEKSRKQFQCSESCKIMSQVKIQKSGCWEWQGILDQRGYGYLTRSKKNKVRAHRYSYEIFKGKFSKNLFICHSCDNPKCVNPDHLWTGTHSENMKDAYKKRRLPLMYRKSSSNSNKRLKKDQVIKIKEDLVNGLPCWEISRKYQISEDTIQLISKRKTFNNIYVDGFDENLIISKSMPNCEGENNFYSKFTSEDIKKIRKLHEEGMLQKDIAIQFNMSKIHVSRIVRKQSWRHIE